jgi:hypothetical protein
MTWLRPEELAGYLRSEGLEILAVTGFQGDLDVLSVYLHGNAGQWLEGEALSVLARMPGVVCAIESVASPRILLARVAPSQVSSPPDRLTA